MAEHGRWRSRDIISILDFERKELEELFERTDRFVKGYESGTPLKDKIVSTAFFEPSTRTRLSFTVAAIRLGAHVIDLNTEMSSVAKGESLADTVGMLGRYSDLIVLRHPSEGAALFAARLSSKPVINAGDGSQHHPTQAMLDLYTVSRSVGTIDGLEYAVIGDLKYGRAASSFVYGLSKFRPRRVYLVSPPQLAPRQEVRETIAELGLPVSYNTKLDNVVKEVDVLYVTRIQKERFVDQDEYVKVKGSYSVTRETLSEAKKGCIVLHPLPRVDELSYDIDTLEQAVYKKQAEWGVPLRMALLEVIMGDTV
jgi:aspartate carbamoyltransferase catalytic subunit